MFDFLGSLIILFGSLAFFVSSIGLIRMPDLFTKIHATTKTTTIGTILVVFGSLFIHINFGLKLLLIAIFVLLTNPLSSSVLARASK